MYRRLYAYAPPLIALVLTGGCVQMTRHSNMALFGTNTSVGLRVGSSATSVPEIQLGYTRQEAVAMPLLANTSEVGGRSANGNSLNRLSPCRVEEAVRVVGEGSRSQFPIHPCLFVATHGGDVDAYSVLASFGAEFGAGSSTAEGARAEGGLAQYFATGMAAQVLAATGGASVVNSRAATPTPAQTASVGALFASPAQRERAVAQANDYGAFQQRLVDHLNGLADDDAVKQFIARFETQAGFTLLAGSNLCTGKSSCVAAIAGGIYRGRYSDGNLDRALAAVD